MALFLAAGSLFFGVCSVMTVDGSGWPTAFVMAVLALTSLSFAALACLAAGVL